MAQQHPPAKQGKAGTKTEADMKSGGSRKDKSSHDSMSHTKAGSKEGAGGGKKQERHH